MSDAGNINVFRLESREDEDSQRLPFDTSDLDHFERIIQQENEVLLCPKIHPLVTKF